MLYGPSVEEREMTFYIDDLILIYLLGNYIWHDIMVNRLVKEKEMEHGFPESTMNFFNK
jgi:hypothetical protein